MAGTLYLVATPIGNLKDISLRALETLRSVDVIACEDTRHTRKLLNHYEISKPLVSYHEHNEAGRADELLLRIVAGESVAVVSDAGTPGINDPGFVIVKKAIDAGVEIVPIPGAVAFVTAVVASGLSNESVFFGGFLPSKSGERRKRLSELADVPATLVFYESPNRLARSLADCFEVFGDRRAAYGRELTKLHEEFARGTLSGLAATASGSTIKGEIVLMVDRDRDDRHAARDVATLASRVAELEAGGAEPKAALKQAAREFGVAKSEAYRVVEAAKRASRDR